ncbi:MAG: restriction endonuclease subunit S, partial [Firmicutes bacterium]|nr:restriction endonuclease subunit S [Bacillota bacterium]
MKDSGIEWIGQIPEDWEVQRIKNCYSIISGNGFPVNIQGQEHGDYPVCKASDISVNNGGFIMVSANYITKAQATAFNIIPVGSI